ncbi:hypothetical protein [Bradyrhizobium sp. JR3.5]
MNRLWSINPLAGAAVPPDVDWLIGYLAKINSTGRPNETVVQHAFSVNSRLLDLRARGGGTYDLKGNIKKGFRVGPRLADRGLANELARLERAARSRSKGRWIKAWAAVSPRCRHLVWHPPRTPVIKVKRKLKFGLLVGFRRPSLRHKLVGIDGVLIGPPALDALAGIMEARCRLANTPADDRRGNQRNEAANGLAAAIRFAVFELTGRVGFTDDRVQDTCTGPLVALGAAVDAHFGTRIGWRLMASK